MFQRFTSILFGDSLEEGRGLPVDSDFNEKEEDDEWILVDYLANACSGTVGDDLETICSEDVIPLDSPVRCSSCSSLDSATDTDADEGNFLRLEATSGMDESWFITPPPCFMAGGRAPILLETSPLENLLIEHPSISEVQRRASPSAGCYATALLAAHAGFLEQTKNSRLAQRIRENVGRQQLSRNALRRLNLLRDGGAKQAKATGGYVHQPGQRQFNY
ncbi:hypothetical protein DNTS_022598 [Danionella cerebrum]|uniref:Tumor protein p53-inducible nuclear protein 1 n=1 Tax=Danionella cerebrum TaxID=2873325 RepID=A0A553QA36_9TELE|nr:hypothetical protein DNTS_022598 [Danionella translucida]